MSVDHPNRTVVKKGEDTTRKDISVLIVEDDPSLLTLYRDYLSNKYDVDIAKTGKEAKNKAGPNTDIVLLDRRLPNHSGAEILHELRNDKEFSAKVAMLTGVAPTGDILELPIDDYKTKPIDHSEIHDLVRTLLLQRSYEIISQKFFRLNSKRSALKEAGNDKTDAYLQVTDEIERCQKKIEEIIKEINNDSIFRTFPK